MFTLIGLLCGLAIYNFTIINLNFPLALYKKLLKRWESSYIANQYAKIFTVQQETHYPPGNNHASHF